MSSVFLKVVGAEGSSAKDIRTINFRVFAKLPFVGPRTYLALLLSFTFNISLSRTLS
jgi:hypothetical protein